MLGASCDERAVLCKCLAHWLKLQLRVSVTVEFQKLCFRAAEVSCCCERFAIRSKVSGAAFLSSLMKVRVLKRAAECRLV